MRPIHLVAGACAAALFGAVTGAAIGTEPLERGIDAWDHIPRPDIDSEAPKLSEPETLPDHYPLITPRGRFEVAELRERGLYRNRRFAIDPYWVDYSEPAHELAEADYRYLPPEDYEPGPVQTASAAREAARSALARPSGKEEAPLVVAAADVEPLEPPPIAKPAALAGAPRTIDIAAELTARR